MDINSIVELVSIGISAIALLIALIKKGGKKEFTTQELADRVNVKVQKYVNKQCKKNKIELTDLVSEKKENYESTNIEE